MDELKKLLENAGMYEHGGTEPVEYHVEDVYGNTYNIGLAAEDEEADDFSIEKNGRTIASGRFSINTNEEVPHSQIADIKDPYAVLEALYAFAKNNQR